MMVNLKYPQSISPQVCDRDSATQLRLQLHLAASLGLLQSAQAARWIFTGLNLSQAAIYSASSRSSQSESPLAAVDDEANQDAVHFDSVDASPGLRRCTQPSDVRQTVPRVEWKHLDIKTDSEASWLINLSVSILVSRHISRHIVDIAMAYRYVQQAFQNNSGIVWILRKFICWTSQTCRESFWWL